MADGTKVAYVRARLRDNPGDHRCHWSGGAQKAPAAQWSCRPHWYRLPADLRARIWRAGRPGQEVSKTPSPQYVAVAREVQAWIEANPTSQSHSARADQ